MVDVVDHVSGMVDFGSDAAPDFFSIIQLRGTNAMTQTNMRLRIV